MLDFVSRYIQKKVHASTLASLRIMFGLLMTISIVRFWYNGWIEDLYIKPRYHFHYLGFEWVETLGSWTYLLFVLCGICAICITIGFYYRFSIIVFFLSFTYIELMDKTTYLNHYYFISVLSLLLIFLPASAYCSVDAYRDNTRSYEFIPQWCIDCLKVLIGIVYIYAGFAKLNSDWMLHAMPLAIWLPSKVDIPLLSSLVSERWLHYAFSWTGAIYDIFIIFLLLFKRTRVFGFALVIVFHVLTRLLFPIGMFPYIMIVATTIFFAADVHKSSLTKLLSLIHINLTVFDNRREFRTDLRQKVNLVMVLALLSFQILFPWRYLLHEGNVFWTEEGYRFSWRVMLMEKAGYASFQVVDKITKERFYITNSDFLTSFQEKQMSTQVDFMLEYARIIEKDYASQGMDNIAIYVDSYVALNGRSSRVYVNPAIDLLDVTTSDSYSKLLMPFDD